MPLRPTPADGVRTGQGHQAPYKVGTLCAVPAGPHWHHFSTGVEPLRNLAIVPRGTYEPKPGTKD